MYFRYSKGSLNFPAIESNYILYLSCLSLSPAKKEVLRAFLNHEKPVKPIQISKEMEKKFPSVMMHILGLIRMGYLVSPIKGYYEMTIEGKRYLGVPEISKKFARDLLIGKFSGNIFNFYLALHEPIDLKAYNLQSLVSAIKTAPIQSIEFHIRRGDFKVWLQGIGDLDLANKIELLENSNLSGELLRQELHVTIFNRCIVLAKVGRFNVVRK